MLKKITEQDIESSGVVGAPDKLEGDPEENKRVFDRLIKEVVAQVVNAIIDAHNELCVDVDALAEQLSDHVDVDPGNMKAQNVSVLRELADQYGLTEKMAPTVHDALEALGAVAETKEDLVKLAPANRYLDHWWIRRRALTVEDDTCLGDTVDGSGKEDYAFALGTHGRYDAVEFTYASKIAVAESGVSLLGPDPYSCAPVEFEEATLSEMLRGKYVCGCHGENKGKVFRICDDAEIVLWGGNSIPYWLTADKLQQVCFTPIDRPWERIHDVGRNAYPDSGELGGMEYRYMGVPVERLIDMMVKEATTE